MSQEEFYVAYLKAVDDSWEALQNLFPEAGFRFAKTEKYNVHQWRINQRANEKQVITFMKNKFPIKMDRTLSSKREKGIDYEYRFSVAGICRNGTLHIRSTEYSSFKKLLIVIKEVDERMKHIHVDVDTDTFDSCINKNDKTKAEDVLKFIRNSIHVGAIPLSGGAQPMDIDTHCPWQAIGTLTKVVESLASRRGCI